MNSTPQPGEPATPSEENAPISSDLLGLNDVVHQKTRLAIMVTLDAAESAGFSYLKKTLEMTDGNLGRHLEVLAAEGLITVTKSFHGRRPRTRVQLTEKGRQALASEMSVLTILTDLFRAKNSGSA